MSRGILINPPTQTLKTALIHILEKPFDCLLVHPSLKLSHAQSESTHQRRWEGDGWIAPMLGKIIGYKSVLKNEKVDLIWRCFESIGRVETNSRKLLKLVMAVAYWMTSVMLDWSLHQIKEMTIKRTNPAVQAEILKDFQKPPKNLGKALFL